MDLHPGSEQRHVHEAKRTESDPIRRPCRKTKIGIGIWWSTARICDLYYRLNVFPIRVFLLCARGGKIFRFS